MFNHIDTESLRCSKIHIWIPLYSQGILIYDSHIDAWRCIFWIVIKVVRYRGIAATPDGMRCYQPSIKVICVITVVDITIRNALFQSSYHIHFCIVIKQFLKKFHVEAATCNIVVFICYGLTLCQCICPPFAHKSVIIFKLSNCKRGRIIRGNRWFW